MFKISSDVDLIRSWFFKIHCKFLEQETLIGALHLEKKINANNFFFFKTLNQYHFFAFETKTFLEIPIWYYFKLLSSHTTQKSKAYNVILFCYTRIFNLYLNHTYQGNIGLYSFAIKDVWDTFIMWRNFFWNTQWN